MRVGEIMTEGVETAAVNEPAERAYDRMRAARVHHLVVVEDGRVVGVLSERDLGGPGGGVVRRGRSVADVMTPHAVTATRETTIREAANLLRGRTIGCLPVVERKKLVGILTTTDLLTLLGRGAEKPSPRGKRASISRLRKNTPQTQAAGRANGR